MFCNQHNKVYRFMTAEVVELVDTQVSGICGATRGGSSPLFGILTTQDFRLKNTSIFRL